jgi:hypothetical protein
VLLSFLVWSILLYVCCVSKKCCVYLEFGLFVLITCIWSLYLVLKFLPVCPKPEPTQLDPPEEESLFLYKGRGDG